LLRQIQSFLEKFELDKTKLLTFLDARGAAAVLRFVGHYQTAP